MSRGCPVDARTLLQRCPSVSIFLRSDTAREMGTCVETDRRALRVHLGADVAASLRTLQAAFLAAPRS